MWECEVSVNSRSRESLRARAEMFSASWWGGGHGIEEEVLVCTLLLLLGREVGCGAPFCGFLGLGKPKRLTVRLHCAPTAVAVMGPSISRSSASSASSGICGCEGAGF